MLDFNMMYTAEDMVKQLNEDMLSSDDAFRTAYTNPETQIHWYWYVLSEICSAKIDIPTLLRFSGDTIKQNPQFKKSVEMFLADHPGLFENDINFDTATMNLFAIIFEVAHEENWLSPFLNDRYQGLLRQLYRRIHNPATFASHYDGIYLPRRVPEGFNLFLEYAAYNPIPETRILVAVDYVLATNLGVPNLSDTSSQLINEIEQLRWYLLRDIWLSAVVGETEYHETRGLSISVLEALHGAAFQDSARNAYLEALNKNMSAADRALLSTPHLNLIAYQPAPVRR